ncbi:MAG: hypothetical protein AAGF12_24315 [Myxococcota bacterium]
MIQPAPTRRAATRTVTALALFVIGGCSFLNKPDDINPASDGATDRSVDLNIPDADAGDGDGGEGGCPTGDVEICGDGIDNNCNAAIDCADFACAPQAECCAEGETQTFNWDGATVGWDPVPANPRPMFLDNEVRFDATTRTAMVFGCQPLALGLDINLTFQLKEPCADCDAAVVLTPSNSRRPNERLAADLAVTLESTGNLVVSQAGVEIMRRDAIVPPAVGTTLPVSLRVAPGVTEQGRVALFATVTATPGVTPDLIIKDFPFLDQRNLLSISGCDEGILGLFVGLEGRGAGVVVERGFELATQECVNPSQYIRPGGAGDRILLSHSSPPPSGYATLNVSEWGQGGIGAPAIAASSVTAGDNVWDIFYDATDVQRRIAQTNDIGFSIGHSAVASDAAWDGTWNAATLPKVGDCHPSCLDPMPVGCAMMCTGDPEHLREPTIYNGMDSVTFQAAAAQERAFGSGIFDIAYNSSMSGNEMTVGAPFEMTVLEPTSPCVSLRDPNLIQANGTNRLWLFYTCEKENDPSDIRAVRLTAAGTVETDPMVVLDSAAVGRPFAEGGVRAPEVWVDYETGGDRGIFRLWFTALDRGLAQTTIGLAQAQQTTMEATMGLLPEFTAYDGNPVISDADIGNGSCEQGCSITGLAVTRIASESNRLRFLLARSVQTSSGVRYEFVPFDQYWRPSWQSDSGG